MPFALRSRVLPVLTAAIFAASAAVPRATSEDYPTHGDSALAGIGAEYLVHSVPTEMGMLLAGRYLVVEVGIFPRNHEEVAISLSQFRLIVNGRSLPEPDAPGLVSASMKYSDWEPKRGVQAVGGIGPIIVGPQQPAGRFPGDPNAPPPIQTPPAPEDPTGAPNQQLSIDDLIARAALPVVSVRKPIGGCAFFHYDGKMAKIRTVELVWDASNAQPVTLKLK